jgi:aromatic ring-opening dioxygenase LigB subunit
VLVAAAVCPHPPVLVPAIASGAAAELDELRETCRRAVARALAADADTVFIVGADVGLRADSFAGWAPGVAAAAIRLDVPEPLPLPLLVGAWLTGGIRRSFVAVEPSLDAEQCGALGADLADTAERVVLLVMGDGSGRHDVKAPGYVDEAAPVYDAAVSSALAAGDPDALLDLDPKESERLLAVGRAPWQVLAGAAVGRDWAVQDHAFAAPYGVGYHVVSWT